MYAPFAVYRFERMNDKAKQKMTLNMINRVVPLHVCTALSETIKGVWCLSLVPLLPFL